MPADVLVNRRPRAHPAGPVLAPVHAAVTGT